MEEEGVVSYFFLCGAFDRASFFERGECSFVDAFGCCGEEWFDGVDVVSAGGDFGDEFCGVVDEVGGVCILLVVANHGADDEAAEAFFRMVGRGGEV